MIRSLSAVLLAPNAVLEERLREIGVPLAAPGETFAVAVVPPGLTEERWHDALQRFPEAGWVFPESLKRFTEGLKRPAALYPDAATEDDSRGRGVVKLFSFSKTQAREEVAFRPKRPLRDALRAALHTAYAGLNIPMPVLSYYPSGYRSVFSFRVDADEYDAAQFSRFFQAAAPNARHISIFFCMASYDSQPDEIRRCREAGFDLHSHAYTHYTYRSIAQNLFNMRKAGEALKRAGIPQNGFCSPYGRWNPKLQKAIDETGFAFSSEFSYDYDGVPSYPVMDGQRSPTLQVPVHPVGLGVYMEAAGNYDAAEISAYFKKNFEAKLAAGEPLLFYDHPTTWLGVYPEVMHHFFNWADRADIWKASMSEWADWWGKRRYLNWDAALTDGNPRFSFNASSLGDLAPSVRLYEPQIPPVSAELSAGEIFIDRHPLRMAKKAVKHWLDWETATPREEIIRDSARGMIKSALRGVWIKR